MTHLSQKKETTNDNTDQNNNDPVNSIQGLDFDEPKTNKDIDTHDELLRFDWEIDEKELNNFRQNKQCESDTIEFIEFPHYVWILSLKQTSVHFDTIKLQLRFSKIPIDIGGVKMNCKIICDQLLYSQEYKDTMLKMTEFPLNENGNHFEEILTLETFDSSVFDNKKITSLKFKMGIEILVRYDIQGSMLTEIDMPLSIAPSTENNLIVYGYLNDIYDFITNQIEATPLSIYELIYKYYLMMIKVEGKRCEFLWKFEKRSHVQLFKNCEYGDVLTSCKFQVYGCVFLLELTPNGWGLWKEGECAVWLAVNTIPSNMDSIYIYYRVICDDVEYKAERHKRLWNPYKGEYSCTPDADLAMDFVKFKELKKFELKICIEIVNHSKPLLNAF